MKVKELISRLNQFPLDYEVQVHYEICCWSEIEDFYIQEDKDNKIVKIDLDGECNEKSK